MGMPVKLSDDLVRAARKEAEAASRSITSQIEHWARLGRAAESVLPHRDVLSLTEMLEGLIHRKVGLLTSTRQRIRDLLIVVARSINRSSVQAELGAGGRVLYESDPRDPDLVVRVAPNGRRTRGRFGDRGFEPLTGRRRVRRSG